MGMLQMSSDKTKEHSLKNSLPLLKCKCGHEILILPDLKTMGRVIEEHAMEHKKKYALTQEEADAVQDNLIAQALMIISKIIPSSTDIHVRLSPKNQKKIEE
jgi:hypothetical protein